MQRVERMKQYHSQFVFVALFAVLAAVFSSSTFAQDSPTADKKAILGKWNMESIDPNDVSIKWFMEVKEKDGSFVATITSADGNVQELKSFTVIDNVVKFKAPYQGEDYPIELQLKDGRLEGKWHSGDGDSGVTRGTKALPE